MTKRKTIATTARYLPSPHDGERPYLDAAADFRAMIAQHRTEARRLADDLQTEIERMEIEIRARMQRLGECEEVVTRCDAALGTAVPPVRSAPNLGERTAQ